MKLGVGFFEIGDGQPEVAFGCRKGTVAKQVLNMAQTGVVLDQVRGTTVTPHVRSDHFFDFCELGVLFHQSSQAIGIQSISPIRDKEPVGLSRFQQSGAAFKPGHLNLVKPGVRSKPSTIDH